MLWLISDARNDARLAEALRHLPRGSGFVFRHYHLPPSARRTRFEQLARIARASGHWTALADEPALARQWGADGVYGPSGRVASAGGLLRIATVHSLRELGAAHRGGADLVMISPVFATRSHPGGKALGRVRALLLARRALASVVLLGGMDDHRARTLASRSLTGRAIVGWAAIDGLAGGPGQ